MAKAEQGSLRNAGLSESADERVMGQTAGQKTVLFLQGPPSGFPRDVAREIEALGHRALRINLGPGDWLYWHDRRAVNYRGRLRDWPAYLEDFVKRHGVTDIVYYQDRFPYHAAAVEVGRRLGVTTIAYEFGYLRPDWITVERDGMSALSRFPDDPAVILAAAKHLPEIDRRRLYPFTFEREAVFEVCYNLSNVFFWGFYPFFSQDKFYHPLAEYVAMIPRLLLSRWRDKDAKMLIDDVVDAGCPYFVFPLQLQSDYQLRYNAPFTHLAEAAEMVMASFAKHAPSESRLVFKVHPLDNGIEPWRKILKHLARHYGLKRRVYIIDGGNLDTLLRNASGALMVNSTTGLHALRVGCPTKILGVAVYDIPGLTHQGSLDTFWREAEPPDQDLLLALEKLMAAAIQVKGNFYTREGRDAAAREMARRIINETVNLPDALVDPPPRVARARSLGLPVTFSEQMAVQVQTGRWRYAWQD